MEELARQEREKEQSFALEWAEASSQ